MVHPIRKVSTVKKIRTAISSPFLMPIAIFLFVIVTLPIVFLVSQNRQDIRQQAATITSGAIVINTEDVSYDIAAQEVAPERAVNWTIGIVVVFIISVGIASIIAYRVRVSRL